jgi:hypothetical protein
LCGPPWKPQSMRVRCHPGISRTWLPRLAGAASIGECGESAVGVPGDVVEVPDGCVAERVTAGLLSKPDEFGEPAVEVAGITAHNRP